MEKAYTIPISVRNHICPQEVILMQADVNYAKIYFADGTAFIIAKTLKEMEVRLKTHDFFRPNKSFLINIHQIAQTSVINNGLVLLMSNNQKVALSKRKNIEMKRSSKGFENIKIT